MIFKSKKVEFYTCLALTVVFLLMTLFFGFTCGWGAGETIAGYCLTGGFAILTGLSYYWWKHE